MRKITPSETAQLLKAADNYLILTHKRPDGDTIGSASALCLALQKAGKTAYMFENTEITSKYAPFAEGLFPPKGFSPERIISCDVASENQFPVGGESYTDGVYVAIDHHMSNTGFAENLCLVDTASCGEIIYEVITELGVTVDSQIADRIYTAVSTDTGCFAYANVTAGALYTASVVVGAGADIKRLNKILFRTKTKARAALDGYIYSNIRYYHGGLTAVVPVTLKMRQALGITEDDLDDVASVSTVIEGVTAGLTLKELPDGVKVSVRTVGDLNANDICAFFGGGGHKQAAGCFIAKPLEEAEHLLVEAVGKVRA